MIRKLATITATAIAAVALAACSASTPRATAAHPGAGPSLAAQLAAPATCDHVHIARWGVATCRAWDRLDAKQRAVAGQPIRGIVVQSVAITATTATLDYCARGSVTSAGKYRISWPGTQWGALVATGPVSAADPTSITEASFSCANI